MTGLKEIFTETWGGLAATEIIAIDWVIRLSKISVISKKSSHFLVTMTTKISSTKQESQGNKERLEPQKTSCAFRDQKN